MHRQRHDAMINGVRTPPLKSDQFIVADGGFSVSLVTPRSYLAQRIRAEKVARLGKREMGYDFSAFTRFDPNDQYDAHVFLGHKAGRAIGLLVLRSRPVVRHFTWIDGSKRIDTGEREFAPSRRWTVDFVWLHPSHRRQGLAIQLLNTAAAYMCIDVQQFAWTTPFSEAGEQLARRLSPQSFFVGF